MHEGQKHLLIWGPPLDIGGGGGWSFCLAFFIDFTREMESFFVRLYFHHALGPFI